MPRIANEVTGTRMFSLMKISTQIRAGTVHATMSALVGTLLRSDTFESQVWRGSMPSRANEYSRRLAAACRLSTHEMKARIATITIHQIEGGPPVASATASSE